MFADLFLSRHFAEMNGKVCIFHRKLISQFKALLKIFNWVSSWRKLFSSKIRCSKTWNKLIWAAQMKMLRYQKFSIIIFFSPKNITTFERINFCGLNQLGLFVEPSFPVFSQNLPNLRKLIPLRYIAFWIFQILVSSTCWW